MTDDYVLVDASTPARVSPNALRDAKAPRLLPGRWVRLIWLRLRALAGAAYEEDSGYSYQGYYCEDQGYDAESSAAAGYSG